MLAESSRAAERAQISRELHDTLGHSLTVLNVNLELASHLTNGRAAEAVTAAQTVTRMLLADVREVVHSLGDVRPIDLPSALATLVAGATAPVIHLSLPENLAVGDPSKAHVVFRCVQEAITNAVKHARARNLWIQLTQSADGLDVHIADDGQGGTAVQPGHGLKGMRERLEAAGGWLKVHAAPGRGFTHRRVDSSAEGAAVIRVALVDDQTLMREGLRKLLELTDDIEVVAEASDGAEAIEMIPRVEPRRGAARRPHAAPLGHRRPPHPSRRKSSAADNPADDLRRRRGAARRASGPARGASC